MMSELDYQVKSELAYQVKSALATVCSLEDGSRIF